MCPSRLVLREGTHPQENMLGGDGGTGGEEGAGGKPVMTPIKVAQEAAASACKHAQSPMEPRVVGNVQM